MVFMKDVFEEVSFEKKSVDDKKKNSACNASRCDHELLFQNGGKMFFGRYGLLFKQINFSPSLLKCLFLTFNILLESKINIS